MLTYHEQGLSPRVRGNHALVRGGRVLDGSIPRVRGNRMCEMRDWASVWSIPACAGEPSVSPKPVHRAEVYPRVWRGTGGRSGRHRQAGGLSPRVRGNPAVAGKTGMSVGLSPRVRGNHWHGLAPGRRVRSIPACAGEPYYGAPVPGAGRVYPACAGEPARTPTSRSTAVGLSPRVRGNRQPQQCRTDKTVYPRVCGGTAA